MTAKFTCPNCSAETEIEDAFIGQTGPCFNCGKTVTIEASTKETDSDPKPQNSGIIIGLVMAAVVFGTIAAIVVVWLVMFFAQPVVNSLQTASVQSRCQTNLRQIAMAMLTYHEDWGSYPPAVQNDANGKPAHSWRVLLLPYLENKTLYDQYDFSQPWDSPTNIYVANQMPSVFGCPADKSSLAAGKTNYMVIVGKETMFPGTSTTKRQDTLDQVQNTLMVVEVTGANIRWTEPKDLDIRGMTFEVNGGSGGTEISSNHPGIALFATGDGKVHTLPEDTAPAVIEALITASGSEQFSIDELPSGDD